jgi:hypothetical protein
MRAIRRLRGDEEGALIVFFAFALAVLLGLVALSFDLGRVASTQTELQSFADSVALAAAAELDGKSDSITRATQAAQNLIQDRQTFARNDFALDVNDFTLTFLRSLPSDDVAAATDVTTDPLRARYVRVDVEEHLVSMGFASALSALRGGIGNRTSGVTATATAGFTQYACQVTPLMFCLPRPNYRADDPNNRGDLIVLRTSRQNAAWQPGNFGFLDPTTTAVPDPSGPCGGRLNGRNLYSCLVGAAGPVTQCYDMRGVDMLPGQRVGIAEAFNVRFDLYDSTMGGERNVAEYAPAPNTIKGYANVRRGNGNGQCDIVTDNRSMGLPRDDCMATNTCPSGNSRFGDGTWTQGRAAYVEANYGDGNPATPETDPHAIATTRYEYYLSELASRTASGILAGGRAETGVAQCHATPSADPNRRVLIAAGIDCSTTTFTGRATGVPVEQFFRVFMIGPASRADSESPPNIDIMVEVIGSAGGAGSIADGSFRDVVQLYR